MSICIAPSDFIYQRPCMHACLGSGIKTVVHSAISNFDRVVATFLNICDLPAGRPRSPFPIPRSPLPVPRFPVPCFKDSRTQLAPCGFIIHKRTILYFRLLNMDVSLFVVCRELINSRGSRA